MDRDSLHGSRVSHRGREWIWGVAATPFAWALSGLLGAVGGWSMVEPFFEDGGSLDRVNLAGAFFFPVAAGSSVACILFIGSALQKQPTRGLLVAIGGFSVALVCVYLALAPSQIAFKWLMAGNASSADSVFPSTLMSAMIARGMSWALLGAAAGTGMGMVTGRGWGLFGGAMGGYLGGLIGGLAFDPLHVLLHPLVPGPAWSSRLASFATLGTLMGFVPGVMDAYVVRPNVHGASAHREARDQPKKRRRIHHQDTKAPRDQETIFMMFYSLTGGPMTTPGSSVRQNPQSDSRSSWCLGVLVVNILTLWAVCHGSPAERLPRIE